MPTPGRTKKTSHPKHPATLSPKSTQPSLVHYDDRLDYRAQDLEEEDESNFIDPSFTRSSTIQPTYNDKLLLYSLFKQAVNGDVRDSAVSRPGVFDLLGRAKWDAWRSRSGLSCIEAKKLYLESVLKILRSNRHSAEAKSLMEMLSSYEHYVSTATDRSSDLSDQDLHSGPVSTYTPQAPDLSRRKKRIQAVDLQQYGSADAGSDPPGEDVASIVIGPYTTSSQLPDPVVPSSSRGHLLPPNSPNSNASSEKCSLNSTQNHSSTSSPGKRLAFEATGKQECAASDEDDEDDQVSVTRSERKFTEEQVQRLVRETRRADHALGTRRDRPSTSPGNDDARLDNPTDQRIKHLDRCIVDLETLATRLRSDLQLLTALVTRKPSPLESNNNTDLPGPHHLGDATETSAFDTHHQQPPLKHTHPPSVFHKFITSWCCCSSPTWRALCRRWTRSHRLLDFFLDLSLFYLAVKFVKFYQDRKKKKT